MATPSTKPIPEGYTTITACITCKDARKQIEFLKEAFGAEERGLIACPETNRVLHAEVKVGTSHFMLSDAVPGFPCKPTHELGGASASFYVYVKDADAAFEKATKAGGKVACPPTDMFWGDRMGAIECPEGFSWSIATHEIDYTKDEMEAGAREFAEMMKQSAQG